MLDKWAARRSKTGTYPKTIDHNNTPEHIAIIMDGNGRWAKQRGLPRMAGHREGMKTVRKVVSKANELGVKALTLYAFSTENWKRPKEEVNFLMKLPSQYLLIDLPDLIKKNVKVRIMGSEDDLPPQTTKAVRHAVEKTKDNTGLVLNFAFNYGGRHEITLAIQNLARDVMDGKIDDHDIDEALISRYLLSDLSDPDLLIRTSGEIRLSNFMLWQLAYTELWFTDVFWPDFTEEHLDEAIEEYRRRGRRYGGVKT